MLDPPAVPVAMVTHTASTHTCPGEFVVLFWSRNHRYCSPEELDLGLVGNVVPLCCRWCYPPLEPGTVGNVVQSLKNRSVEFQFDLKKEGSGCCSPSSEASWAL